MKKRARKPQIFYIAKNGMKIQLFGSKAVYEPAILDSFHQEVANELRLPKDMLFPEAQK